MEGLNPEELWRMVVGRGSILKSCVQMMTVSRPTAD